MFVCILLATLLFVGALMGWGRLLVALVAPRQGIGWASAAMIGYAMCAVIGGICELTRCISPLLAQLLLGCGAAAAATFAVHDVMTRAKALQHAASWRHAYLAWTMGAAIVLILVGFLLGAAGSPLDQCDDELAYALMPLKMLENGTLGSDPFCTRRLESGFGGQSFMLALLLGELPATAMPLLEHGIARLLLAAAALEFACRAGLRSWRAAAVALLALWPIPELNNTTSMVSGAALLIVLMGMLLHARGWGRLILAGTLVAGTCSLKHTHIPACGLVLAGWVLLGPEDGLRGRLRMGLMTGGIAVLLLAPWMIDMWRYYRTPLYPLLGRGIHGTAYGLYGYPNDGIGLGGLLAIAGRLLLHPLPLAAFAFSLCAASASRLGRAAWIGLAAAVGSLTMLSLLTAGTSSERYAYPTTMMALVVGATAALAWPVTASAAVGMARAAAMRTGLALIIGLLVFASGWREFHRWYGLAVFDALHAPASWPAPSHAQSAAALQRAVPSGARILLRIAHPLACDFTRNELWLIDWPGGTSPPPGLDCRAAPAAIADYLRKVGVRYVAYSYRDESGYPRHAHAGELADLRQPWLRNAAAHALAFQDALMDCACTYPRIFDDGYLFVLDLGAAAGATARP